MSLAEQVAALETERDELRAREQAREERARRWSTEAGPLMPLPVAQALVRELLDDVRMNEAEVSALRVLLYETGDHPKRLVRPSARAVRLRRVE